MPGQSNDSLPTVAEVAQLRTQLAEAQQKASRLAVELDAANERVADLQDRSPVGTTDPFIRRLALLKYRVGASRFGSVLQPLYRSLIRR